MGWASGSSLLDEVAKIVMPHVLDDESKRRVAGELIDAFESEDCDTINECEQEDIRAEYDRRNPPELD